jgi:hypothetical protein
LVATEPDPQSAAKIKPANIFFISCFDFFSSFQAFCHTWLGIVINTLISRGIVHNSPQAQI